MRFTNPYTRNVNNNQTGVKAIHRNIAMKMTMSTGSTMTPRVHRKVIRAPSKLHPGKIHPGKLHPGKRQPSKGIPSKMTLMHQHHQMQHTGKLITSRGKLLARGQSLPRPIESCDNSNDSGLGFDSLEMHIPHRNGAVRFSEQLDTSWKGENAQAKFPKPEVKFDSDNANDNFNFPEMTKASKQPSSTVSTYRTGLGGGKVASSLAARRRAALSHLPPLGPINLCSQLPAHTRDGRVQLQILSQPEQQHRARYQTEGSRGAVKDRSGNSFPIVKLIGYDKPTTMQVFIGTDVGRVAPHMFYQACRVFGKNSTPCSEKKEDGTVLIEIEFDPQKNFQITCDCVGILKERNVDVEHRFGDQTGQRCKKKSTRCRMVFRTQIQNPDGTMETIQVSSQQIVCTQPPGIPEICRKSLVSCPASGGLELFLLGKNFLKDTKVVFQADINHTQVGWKEQVSPDKEFLQQNHLVCCVPSYIHTNITEPVSVKLFVVSGGKGSEPHKFVYTPVTKNPGPQHATFHHSAQGLVNGYYLNNELKEEVKPVLLWESTTSSEIMPPPSIPLRRPSVILPDPHSPLLNDFKSELADDSSQGSVIDNENGDIVPMHLRNNRFQIHNENSMDVSDNSMDASHIRSHQCSDNMKHDTSLCINQHSENSNMSLVVNDNSVDMIRLNETTNAVCQMNESNMEMIIRHNDSSELPVKENSVNQFSQTNNIVSQIIPPQIINTNLDHQNQVINNAVPCEILNGSRHMSPDELKVIDLRMKPGGMGSESDPSLATIRQFMGVHNKLPTQSGQSVENYFSNNDNKSLLSQTLEKPTQLTTFSQQLQNLQSHNSTDKVMESVAAAIFQSTDGTNNGSSLYPTQPTIQQIVMPPVTPMEQLIVSKRIHDSIMQDMSIANNIISGSMNDPQVKTELYNTNCNRVDLGREKLSSAVTMPHHASMLNNQNVPIDALVSSAYHSNIMGSSVPSASNLDAMMNPSTENHLSPSHTDSSPPRRSPSTHDIILSSHSSPDIAMNANNSTQISPVNQELIHSHNTNVLSPEIILNPQVSPSMMCSQDGALLGSQPLGSAISQQLLPNNHALNQSTQDGLTIMTNNQSNQNDNLLMSSPHMMSPTVKTPPAAVKSMILNAAAEIFTSDKAIDALVTTAIETANILTNENVQNQPTLLCTQAASGTVVELQQQSNQQNLGGSGAQYSSALPYTPQIPTEPFSSQTIVDTAVGNLVSHMKEDNVTETSAMSQAVTQVVSQVFSQAVSQAVNQEMKTSNSAPMQDLTSMTDNELLSYINPSCFDQV